MNYVEFTKKWKEMIVYSKSIDVDENINDDYTLYKTTKAAFPTDEIFFRDHYQDFDIHTHGYMLKSKAMKTKHANGLINMANKFRDGMGLERIPFNE